MHVTTDHTIYWMLLHKLSFTRIFWADSYIFRGCRSVITLLQYSSELTKSVSQLGGHHKYIICGGHRELSHSMPSMIAGVCWGALFNNIDAFNLARTTATRCDRCLMTSLSSSPLFLASALPILLTCSTIVSDQAPRVSTGRGQKVRPASLHGSPCLDIFLS